MLRLPWFEHRAPRSVAEAAKILAGEGPRAMLIAGGTDLLPNMKRRQMAPKVLVALTGVSELKMNGSAYGAKEVGQGPLLPVMPAVANAIYDAVGVRIDEIPITPDKVLRALERKDKRVGPESFPAVPYPEPIFVLPPWEEGDGKETKRNAAAAVV